MGDRYVHDEFKRHKSAAPQFVDKFLKEWNVYLGTLHQQRQTDAGVSGISLDSKTMDNLTQEQWGQLYELKNAAKEIK